MSVYAACFIFLFDFFYLLLLIIIIYFTYSRNAAPALLAALETRAARRLQEDIGSGAGSGSGTYLRLSCAMVSHIAPLVALCYVTGPCSGVQRCSELREHLRSSTASGGV